MRNDEIPTEAIIENLKELIFISKFMKNKKKFKKERKQIKKMCESFKKGEYEKYVEGYDYE